MNLTGSIIIYVLIWWIIFFFFFFFYVDRDKKNFVDGVDPGAPDNPKLIKKLLYTTFITSIIFIGILLLVKYDYLNLRNLIK